ncbi:polycomb group protein ASXL1-like isoform X2 [Polyodon spathula]|uniref:polycomb group protein ASXL1-like isoform X2 n=1 Tax=Polyodon spathula TaxID=7913 RepID=UPI001B7EDDB2|nr:polycomb group protein ASXL1-like isoform X2 [Polyodon spathula]
MKDKQKKKKERTWAEAARMVLENYSDAPMTPKQILHVIETKGLKEMRSGTSPLACLNTMLHSQCRGDDGIFFKLPGRLSLFTLKKDARQWSKSMAVPEGEGLEDPADVESCDSNETSPAMSLDETSSSASCSTETQSKQTPQARQSSLRAAQQGRAANASSERESGRQRKKGVMMPRVVLTPLKVNGEHVTSGFPGKRREVELSSTCSSSSTIACSSSLRSRAELSRKHGQRFKNLHKSRTGQMKRNKGEEVDFETPGSILVNTNIRALINTRTLATLPPHLQQQLLLLLPEVDRPVGVDGLARISSSALNNEFFTHASLCWKERLADGEFTHEMQVRIRQEMEKEKKVELWKEKFFEDYYGQRLGLTKEESLKQTLVQEDSGNLTAAAIPTGPAKKRAAGRRRKDGRLRRRSRSDLRTRARRALCRQPKLEEAEDHSESAAAAASGIEATSKGEHKIQTDLEDAGTEAQATHAISVAAVSLVGGQLEMPAALCSVDSSSSPDNQRDLGAASASPDERAYLSTDASDKNNSGEVKDQKRKFGEPTASTSFPEKKPRLDARQSFRNTIDCVHSEKPHHTKEEPKVPPIRIQLSRIKPPWVVKGPPTYQICPRIIPNQETDSRGRTGARTLADVKARAQQARAQREAAAAVAAAGGVEGPERGGGPGGGGGRRDCYEPAEPGGSKGVLTEALSNHLEGAQLQQDPVEGTEDKMVSETELLQNVKSEIIQTEISLEKDCKIRVLPKVFHSPVGSARYADPAGIDRKSASQQIDDPNYTDVIYTEEVEPVSEEDKAVQVIETREQVVEMMCEPVGMEDHLETETSSEEIACQYFEVKSDVVTVLVPTSIPDTLPRFGAEGIDALRTLVSLQPLEGVHSVYKEIKVKKYKAKEVENEDDEECISPRLPNHKEERNGHGTEITLKNCEQLNKTQSPEKTKPRAQLLHIKGVACISEDFSSSVPCIDVERHASNQTLLVDLDLVSACLHSEAGMHSDSTETASDFENEMGEEHSWHAEIDKKCSPDTASTIFPSRPVAAAKSNGWNPVSEACQASSNRHNIDNGRKKENKDSSQTEAHNPLSTVQKNAEAPRKAGSSSRHVSSVEANNPLVTQLLQGSLPLEKVLPQPNSTSKLEIHRLPVPLPMPQENQSVKSVQSSIGRGEDSCTTNSKTHQDLPPKAGQGHLKSYLAHTEVWVQSRVSSNEISPRGGQIHGSQEQVNTVVTPNTHEDSRVSEQGKSSCFFEEVENIAGGRSQVHSPALSNNNPSNSAFGQNSSFGLIVDKGYPGVPGQKGAAQECKAGDVQCNTDMNQMPPQNKQVSLQNNFVSREVVPTVKIDWHPKQQPGVKNENLSCQSPSKNVLITGKTDSASPFESKEHFPGTLLNVGMSLVRLTRESGNPFQYPLEPSYIPFQLNIQQQFYGKLPKLHYNSSLGFNYTTNMSISDRALNGFSKNIANSVMQLQQKTFAEHTVEEMALKCSCRLKAMIVCQGCGAFCHDDCIGPSKLCVSCLVR